MANPAKFIREVRQEVSKVAWPTRKETLVSTGMVLALIAFTALFFLLADSIISRIIRALLGIQL